jgi:DNA repair photolyase
MKIYDPYSRFHGKIRLERIVPKLIPLFEMERKEDFMRLSRPHKRAKRLEYLDLFEGSMVELSRPMPKEFTSILELSTRAPYCPCPFTLDTVIGLCPYGCIYCFTNLTYSSLATSFYDSDAPLAPRFANPSFVRDFLDEILKARGVEPYHRETREPRNPCGETHEVKYLKKAAAQRIPLRFGTRSENFIPAEKSVGVALEALKVIRDHSYPLIINTKSDLIVQDPYFKVISEMGKNVAIQVTIVHTNDEVARRLEPGAPPPSRRWEVLRTFNEVGINAMPRMEPAAAFLNNDDEHLEAYFAKARECGCRNFMGDTYHHTVKAEEVRRLFYREGFDFDRMWEATSEFQILGSYVMEKAMYYAKKHGMRAGTFNFHSLPWNDDPVCCMVSEQFDSWNRYSMVHFLKSELIERGRVSFTELDERYYGYELHPSYRKRLREVWNLEIESPWSPDWMEGAIPVGRDERGNIIWEFDPERMGEGYMNLIRMFGGEPE